MGCIVSKLFLDFYIFFIFTRPLSTVYLSNRMKYGWLLRYHEITDYCEGECLLHGKIAPAGRY